MTETPGDGLADPLSDLLSGPLADPRALVGRWALHRTIDDRRGDLGGVVEGVLELSDLGPDRLGWEERATWHRPGAEVAVRRGLRLERREGGWWVLFEDGRDFHPWVPGEPVLHDCRPDTGSPADWSVWWEVTGPAKDYVMRTRLRPASPGDGVHGP